MPYKSADSVDLAGLIKIPMLVVLVILYFVALCNIPSLISANIHGIRYSPLRRSVSFSKLDSPRVYSRSELSERRPSGCQDPNGLLCDGNSVHEGL